MALILPMKPDDVVRINGVRVTVKKRTKLYVLDKIGPVERVSKDEPEAPASAFDMVARDDI